MNSLKMGSVRSVPNRVSVYWVVSAAIWLCVWASLAAQQEYFPERHHWERRNAEAAGLDAGKLQAAIDFAVANESRGDRDLTVQIALSFSREPSGDIVGPTQRRGDPSGIVVRHGYLVAEWGPTRRVDMTFSVTKSFLSTVVGLAYDRGLIRDPNDRVGDSVLTGHFDSPHNSGITWDHLLRQTSDWQGELWGKADWMDRPEGDDSSQWPQRPLHEPGTRWKYNDVRVNLLALAALHVWRRPLPQVLRELVMEPIGASPTWRWHGYRNSWIELDGSKMQSVSGGGHWGGGMFISARDMARFGILLLRRGRWKDQRILSERWIELASTPTPANPNYGFMNWFLNSNGDGAVPSAGPGGVAHLGAGTNAIYVDWDHDLVVVVRWIERGALDGFISRLLGSVQTPQRP